MNIDFSKIGTILPSGACYHTVTEKHFHLHFLGDSKKEFLVGNVKGTNGQYVVFNGLHPDTKQPTGRPPIYAHIYHFEPNVPESKVTEVTDRIRELLADRHGVQPHDIEVRLN